MVVDGVVSRFNQGIVSIAEAFGLVGWKISSMLCPERRSPKDRAVGEFDILSYGGVVVLDSFNT